jgi:hypothetical protein
MRQLHVAGMKPWVTVLKETCSDKNKNLQIEATRWL